LLQVLEIIMDQVAVNSDDMRSYWNVSIGSWSICKQIMMATLFMRDWRVDDRAVAEVTSEWASGERTLDHLCNLDSSVLFVPVDLHAEAPPAVWHISFLQPHCEC
jgi:hypothetical protein